MRTHHSIQSAAFLIAAIGYAFTMVLRGFASTTMGQLLESRTCRRTAGACASTSLTTFMSLNLPVVLTSRAAVAANVLRIFKHKFGLSTCSSAIAFAMVRLSIFVDILWFATDALRTNYLVIARSSSWRSNFDPRMSTGKPASGVINLLALHVRIVRKQLFTALNYSGWLRKRLTL